MHTRTAWVPALAVVLLGAASTVVLAQDANYWSSAYGTRAQLLGGVVIGSPGDISSTYYNPGAFAISKSTELLLAGNAYQYQSVKVDDGSGPGKTLVSSHIATVPSLFAGELPILKHDRVAYAFLTRRAQDIEIDQRTTDVPAFAPIANPVFSAGEINFHTDFSEGWYGFTWGHELRRGLGLGVSPFLVVRSQHGRNALLTEGQDATGAAALLTMTREYDFLYYGLLARIGLAGVRDSLTYGLTVTTPSLKITAGGNTQYNTSLLDQTGTIGTIVGADYEKDRKADFRSPTGVGGGASYGWGGTRLHAAAEWYAEVPRYTVIETSPFIVHTPGGDSTVTLTLTDHLKSVFNWGVGVEHRFNATWSGFAGYHTDVSARDENDPPSASVTHWNLNHVTVGTQLHVWRSDLSLGIESASASQPTPRLPTPPTGQVLPQGLNTHEMLLTVMLGWKITF